MAKTGIVDMHAHWYPEGCLSEVVRDRPEFCWEASAAGGQRLLYRGSYVMSAPHGHDDMAERLDIRREGRQVALCPGPGAGR
jgi:hypothetical protein